MIKSISFSKAVEGFLLNAQAHHLSHYTIKDYPTTFRRFADFLGEDRDIDEINNTHVETFLTGLTESKKTMLNYHVGLIRVV